jgi:hypothetical protein
VEARSQAAASPGDGTGAAAAAAPALARDAAWARSPARDVLVAGATLALLGALLLLGAVAGRRARLGG